MHEMPMQIDCEACPVRGQHCDGCMVPALLSLSPSELPLDPVEVRALDTLVAAGLLPAVEAASARARREPGAATWASAG